MSCLAKDFGPGDEIFMVRGNDESYCFVLPTLYKRVVGGEIINPYTGENFSKETIYRLHLEYQQWVKTKKFFEFVVNEARKIHACLDECEEKSWSDPEPGMFAGYCGLSQAVVYYLLLKMGLSKNNIIISHTTKIWQKCSSHAFIVVMPNKITGPSGWVVDLTVCQFGKCSKMIRKGYFELNWGNLREYMKLLGCRQFPNPRDIDRLINPSNSTDIDWELDDLNVEIRKKCGRVI